MAGLREFNADKNRESREKATVTIDEQKFRRRRMTGRRFREILETEQVSTPPKTQAELEEMTPDERFEYARNRATDDYQDRYRQVARLIQPVDPAAVGVDEDDEDGLYEWLDEHLDWDDVNPLLEWLNKLSGGEGKAGS